MLHLPQPRRRAAGVAALWLWLGCTGCGGEPVPSRPSLLLFVVDTLRADAVSAYGAVAGTTPELDALAVGGLRYANARANAPWTLPSHATLFTGLLPGQHGVDWTRPHAPDSLRTLAEILHDAGYQTAGFSENPWVSETFGLAQGFEAFVDLSGSPTRDALVSAFDAWLEDRDPTRPFFVFMNVMDAHWPFSVRERNRFLPEDVSEAEARATPQWPPDYICPRQPVERAWRVQRGLYLGDVAAADAKLGLVRERLEGAGATRGLVSVVTSDHGEHLGEHGLGNHQFSVREPLLRVPLVVHGLAGVAPGVVESPVHLADLVPSALAWTGAPGPADLPGRLLPTRPGAADSPRLLRASYRDPAGEPRAGEPELARLVRRQAQSLRAHCGAEDRVWGAMRALVLHPWKLVWFDGFPAELYRLSDDPGEKRDLASRRPELVQALVGALDAEPRSERALADLLALAAGEPPH